MHSSACLAGPPPWVGGVEGDVILQSRGPGSECGCCAERPHAQTCCRGMHPHMPPRLQPVSKEDPTKSLIP